MPIIIVSTSLTVHSPRKITSLLASSSEEREKKKLNLTTSHLFISDIQPIYTWTNVVVVQRERRNGWRNVRRSTKATLWAPIASHLVLVGLWRWVEEKCVLRSEDEREKSQSQAAAFYICFECCGRKEQEIQMFSSELFFPSIYIFRLSLPLAMLSSFQM